MYPRGCIGQCHAVADQRNAMTELVDDEGTGVRDEGWDCGRVMMRSHIPGLEEEEKMGRTRLSVVDL